MKHIRNYFDTYPKSKEVHETSNGLLFHTKDSADAHAQSLSSREVNTHNREDFYDGEDYVVVEVTQTMLDLNPGAAEAGYKIGDIIHVSRHDDLTEEEKLQAAKDLGIDIIETPISTLETESQQEESTTDIEDENIDVDDATQDEGTEPETQQEQTTTDIEDENISIDDATQEDSTEPEQSTDNSTTEQAPIKKAAPKKAAKK